MGKLILVTGGARSGKSSYAEDMASQLKGDILYVATSIPCDDEMKLRIKKHIGRRPSNWETLEAYKDFDIKLPPMLHKKSGVLLDCITNLVSNLILENYEDGEDNKNMENYITGEIMKLISISKKSSVPFIMVTNEVGMSLVPEYPLGRLFRDIAGSINQIIAGEADEVYLCVSGIPVKIK